jgi:predicted  nucleic acid-binding Zn-ribbon protein
MNKARTLNHTLFIFMENDKLKELETNIEAIRSAVVSSHKAIMESFKIVDNNFAAIKDKIKVIDDKIDALAHSASKDFETVHGNLRDIKDELDKIEKVSKYSDEYANMLKITR